MTSLKDDEKQESKECSSNVDDDENIDALIEEKNKLGCKMAALGDAQILTVQ